MTDWQVERLIASRIAAAADVPEPQFYRLSSKCKEMTDPYIHTQKERGPAWHLIKIVIIFAKDTK